jgi:hypothetical protein
MYDCATYATLPVMITPEQRDKVPMCGAKRKNGELCRAFAGQGTSHTGIGRCKFHGGATGTHEKAAVKRELQKSMVMMGEPVENVTALQALLQELWASTGHVGWLRQQIADMGHDELGSTYGQAVTSLYNTERDRKTKIARLCIESGVDEAAIRVAEVQVTLVGQALAKAADTAGLSAEMRKRLGAAMREELAAVDAQPHSLSALAAGRAR